MPVLALLATCDRCQGKLAVQRFGLLKSLLGQGADMAIRKELLDILVCPLCKYPVRLLPDGSGLKCEACKRIYPVRDDIPVMLVEEATLAKD